MACSNISEFALHYFQHSEATNELHQEIQQLQLREEHHVHVKLSKPYKLQGVQHGFLVLRE